MIGLQNSRHFLNQWEAKPKPIVVWPHAFSPVWRRLHVFAFISDWLVMLFKSVAIGQSNYFGFGFTTLGGCLHGGRKILALGRSEKAEKRFVFFTCRNFGRSGYQVEKEKKNNCRP